MSKNEYTREGEGVTVKEVAVTSEDIFGLIDDSFRPKHLAYGRLAYTSVLKRAIIAAPETVVPALVELSELWVELKQQHIQPEIANELARLALTAFIATDIRYIIMTERRDQIHALHYVTSHLVDADDELVRRPDLGLNEDHNILKR